MDPCNTVLPLSAKKATEQALARKGSKAWVSNDAKHWSRNLKGKKEALKQNSWDAVRVWWLAVLVRGKLHVEAPHCPEIDFSENACSNRVEKTIFDRTALCARSVILFGRERLRLWLGQNERTPSMACRHKGRLVRERETKKGRSI